MPLWFFLALIGPVLWSIANFMDKYMLQKYFRSQGSGALMIFTGLFGIIPATGIALFHRELASIGFTAAMLIIGNGVVYIFGYLPYLYALQTEEASRVTPMFQLIPVFVYLFALVFLHETLNTAQLLGGAMIVGGAVLFSIRFSDSRPKVHLATIGLMVISSILIASEGVIFKAVALEASFWVTAFWQYLGGLLGAGLLLMVPKYRIDFLSAFHARGGRIVVLNAVNDALNTTGGLLYAFASLLAPIALVSAVNGIQPLILLLMGIFLTKFLPQLGREVIDRRTVTVKIVAGSLMCLGVYILQVIH